MGRRHFTNSKELTVAKFFSVFCPYIEPLAIRTNSGVISDDFV